MKQTIILSKQESEHMKELTSGMLSEELCSKFNYKTDMVIYHSTFFPDNIEARIRLIITEEGFVPITEIVLYKNGIELAHEMDSDLRYDGEWYIEYNGNIYEVEIKYSE